MLGDIATAAAGRLEWLLGAIAAPDGLTVDHLEPLYDQTGWRGWSLEQELAEINGGRLARPFDVGEIDTSKPGQASAVVVDADEKRWAFTVFVEEAPPHRIGGVRCVQAPPPGTIVRDAVAADAAALAALERRSPLRLANEVFQTFDRGDDYFAPARLMEEATVYVAEVDGRLAGVYWGAQQPVVVDGVPKKLFLEHRVRIDPETRRGGVFWALVAYGRETYARSADSIAFYVSPENEALRKFVVSVPPWSVQPARALVPTTVDGETPRRATAADAAEIVEILNACHRGAALYVPYTVESLTARLERSPDQYTWDDVCIGDGAVVGIGRIPVDVTRVRHDDRHQTRRAVALDHGFVPGNDDAYERLVRASAAELASAGVTHLAAFTSRPSHTYDVLAALATELEPYDFWAFDIVEPPSLAANGFYVDPVYF